MRIFGSCLVTQHAGTADGTTNGTQPTLLHYTSSAAEWTPHGETSLASAFHEVDSSGQAANQAGAVVIAPAALPSSPAP